MASPPSAGSASDGAEGRRPLSLLLVYSWDLVRAILAAFGAVAVFGGSREVRGQVQPIPVAVQIFQALAYGALAAALVIVGTLLTRRARWVRRAQLALLLMDVVLVVVTLSVALLTDEGARNLGTVLVGAAFVLVDVLAAVAMTDRRVSVWFDEPGDVPLYLGGLIAFWVAASTAFFALGLLTA